MTTFRKPLGFLLFIFAFVGLTTSATANNILPPPVDDVIVGVEDINRKKLTPNDNDFVDAAYLMSGANIWPDGNGLWNSMVTPPNQDLVPYWDGRSFDFPNGNFGNFVSGTGGFVQDPQSPHWANWQYWALSGGGPDNSVVFYPTGEVVTIKDLQEVSAWSNLGALSWVSTDKTWFPHLLFSGPQGPGATASFRPEGPFFLQFNSPDGIYSSKTRGDQFAFATQIPNMGEVPEPATFVLLGSGLLALGFVRRRARQQQKQE